MKNKVISFIKAFGLPKTLELLIWPSFLSLITRQNIAITSRGVIRSFVKKTISEVIHKYKSESVKIFNKNVIAEDAPIWICWWQGEECMPNLCKLCLKSVRKNKGNHPVIVISQHNYTEYVSISELYLTRLKNAEISITHFTDVLRFTLLKQNGGIWLDAAILMLNPLSLGNLSFYSNKNVEKDNKYISRYRWTGGVLASCHDSIISNFMVDAYNCYWSKYNSIVSFMLMDYLLDIGYEEIAEIKKQIDNIPYTNPDFYSLKSVFHTKCDTTQITKIRKSSMLVSLNRRFEYGDLDSDGNITYYGYFNDVLA